MSSSSQVCDSLIAIKEASRLAASRSAAQEQAQASLNAVVESEARASHLEGEAATFDSRALVAVQSAAAAQVKGDANAVTQFNLLSQNLRSQAQVRST